VHDAREQEEQRPQSENREYIEVNTISGSRVMAKMAGTESTAKTMSLSSMKTSETSKGVA
jgi:hypothetical protein